MAVFWLAALLFSPSGARVVTEPTTIQFTYGIDETLFRPELTTGGNGNGEFEMYVNSNRTTYVANRTLFIKPTLTEHIMEDLNAAGTLNVAKSRAFINQTAQPWTYDNDYYYGGHFAGRRMVLPYKHTRYQTELNNTCDDSSSATPDPSTCENQWAHAYNVIDMTTQAWASGRWDDVRCTGACLQTAGDYVPEGSTDYTYDMLQPIASAKLMTRTQFDLLHGRVEINAKLPRGDWLWPALWLLPSHPDNYGPWPRNGEIDVMESRGNEPARCAGGYNFFGSTLHFGMDYKTDGYAHASEGVQFSKNIRSLSDEFHTYGLMWNTTHIITYLDEPSNIILATDMTNTDFFTLGQTTTTTCRLKDGDISMTQCIKNATNPAQDWSGYVNPWAAPHSFDAAMAPFDTPFYLIFNVAVGGTNGFFSPDCKGSDGSAAPWGSGDPDEIPIDSFMKNSYQWLPTWVEPEDIAWAVHCSLGSAYQLCMPTNPPVTDMTQDGASAKLKTWYESSQASCTTITTATACQQATACEWHAVPCPETADHAALQIKSVVYVPN